MVFVLNKLKYIFEIIKIIFNECDFICVKYIITIRYIYYFICYEKEQFFFDLDFNWKSEFL